MNKLSKSMVILLMGVCFWLAFNLPVRIAEAKTINLVAIGDSLTYGQGDTHHNGGYVGLIKQDLDKKQKAKVKTQNFGKVGDRSDQIMTRVKNSTKIQKALAQANVITMTVGGNDMMKVIQDNFMLMLTDQLDGVMPKEKKSYQKKLQALIRTVRYYNPKAPIFLFSIYNPFYVYFPTIQDLPKYTADWNDIALEQAENDGNIYFVDINDRLSQGQYLNKDQTQLKKESQLDLNKTSSTKVEKMLADEEEKNDYLSSDDHFHPNDKGYRYMTSRLYKVMIKHKKTWMG